MCRLDSTGHLVMCSLWLGLVDKLKDSFEEEILRMKEDGIYFFPVSDVYGLETHMKESLRECVKLTSE